MPSKIHQFRMPSGVVYDAATAALARELLRNGGVLLPSKPAPAADAQPDTSSEG
jgi:hypothetical protein